MRISMYYIPSTKKELVKILFARMTVTKSSLNKMPTNQLYAIFHRMMRDV